MVTARLLALAGTPLHDKAGEMLLPPSLGQTNIVLKGAAPGTSLLLRSIASAGVADSIKRLARTNRLVIRNLFSAGRLRPGTTARNHNANIKPPFPDIRPTVLFLPRTGGKSRRPSVDFAMSKSK